MTDRTSAPYRLRLPGPTAVPETIQQAMVAPIVSHRGPEFQAVIRETASLAKPVLGTANEPMFFTSSGTGMMEAALANVLARGDRALVLANGQFGERFASIARSLFLDVDCLDVPWGEAVSGDTVAARLAKADYQAVVAVHNESSTGAVADLAEIGAAVRDTPAVLVVDSVSGLGGIEMRQDDWGVDVVLSASQKALMCPPGVGLASISGKAWKVISDGRERARFYWDFRKARDSAAKGQTVFTPPVSLITGLREALRMINEEGVANVLSRHHRLADAMRAGGSALGLEIFTKAPIVSDTVTVFTVPEGLDGTDVVRHMYEHYGTVIAGSRSRLKGKVLRIGTMGACTETDILQDLEHLEKTLLDLGWPVRSGAGADAAGESFRQTS